MFKNHNPTPTGVFCQLYEKSLKKIDVNQEKTRLVKFKTNRERYEHVRGLQLFDELPKTEVKTLKSREKSLKLKDFGNKQFGLKAYEQAVGFYNHAAIYADSDDSQNLAIIVANRSAAFFHLNELSNCIEDIEFALKNYPENIKYKLFERLIKSYISLNNSGTKIPSKKFRDAVALLKESLKSADIDVKKRNDLDNLIVKYSDVNNLNQTNQIKDPSNDLEEHPVIKQRNSKISSVIESVDIREEPNLGRYACARSPIQVGEKILVENAYGGVLIPEFLLTHCSGCFKRTRRVIPCKTCTNVVFCSETCAQESTYHAYECPILSDLNQAGISIINHIALRLVTEKNCAFFNGNWNALTANDAKNYGDPYWNIMHFENHENETSSETRFHYAAMAVFLVKYLKKTDYFATIKSKKEKTKVEALIGGLILSLLKSLPFNTHEIFELEIEDGNADQPRTITIGGAVYPTLALFNHSCDPSVVRYFNRKSVVVRAIKNIGTNESISENYGVIYSQTPRKLRQEHLKSKYYFECKCIPCLIDWPLFDQLPDNILRFRCVNKSCSNMFEVNMDDVDQWVIQCLVCKSNFNVLKTLKMLEDTERINGEVADLRMGDRRKLDLLVEKMKILERVLVAPYKDYINCQQQLRECFLHLGNKYVRKPVND